MSSTNQFTPGTQERDNRPYIDLILPQKSVSIPDPDQVKERPSDKTRYVRGVLKNATLSVPVELPGETNLNHLRDLLYKKRCKLVGFRNWPAIGSTSGEPIRRRELAWYDNIRQWVERSFDRYDDGSAEEVGSARVETGLGKSRKKAGQNPQHP